MELLIATVKFLQPLQLTRTTRPRSIGKGDEWISFADAQVQEEGGDTYDDGPGKPAVAETKSHAAELTFDENIGTRLKAQVEFTTAVSDETKASAVAVAWRQWHEQNRTMGAMDADKASGVSAFSLHS